MMNLETFARSESILQLREQLSASKEDRHAGNKGYTVEEVTNMMRDAINEVSIGKRG